MSRATYHGKACKHCNGTLRYVNNWSCVACNTARDRARRLGGPRTWSETNVSRLEVEYAQATAKRVKWVFDLGGAPVRPDHFVTGDRETA